MAIPTNLPAAVSFTDWDPMAGSFGGVVVVTASDESDVSDYVAYWGPLEQNKLAQVKDCIVLWCSELYGHEEQHCLNIWTVQGGGGSFQA